jgi:hypothetical protein
MKTADTIAWYLSLAFLIAAVAHAAYVFCLDSSTMDKATAGLILITGITNAMTSHMNHKRNQ